MRIALLALHFAEYATLLAIALSKAHEVLLILSEPNFENEIGDRSVFSDKEHLQVAMLPHKRDARLIVSNIQRLRKLVNTFEPDIIHCQEEAKDALIGALPFLPDVPFVLTVHDPIMHSGADTRKIRYSRRRYYLSFLRRRADAAIVHGKPMLELAETVIPALKGRIFSVAHGPLGRLFSAQPDTDWQVGNCLFFGRMEEYKGLQYFVEAVRILRSQGVAITGVVAGRGPELERMKPGLLGDSAFVIKDRYLTPGEVADCFRQAHMVVMPYTDASQSGVAAFAMGMGRPAVSSNVGALPEIVRHGETGLLVPPRDSSALASAMLRIFESRVLAARMAKNASRLADEELSWREIARHTEQVYAFTMTGRQRLNRVRSV